MRGLMGTLCFSTSSLTCLGRQRDLTESGNCHQVPPASPSSSQSPPWSVVLQEVPRPGSGTGTRARAVLAFRVSLHHSLHNFPFFSPHPRCSPPVAICSLHILREVFAAGESGQRGFPLDLNSLEMLHPVWKRTSGFVPSHGGEQQGILSHHLCS